MGASLFIAVAAFAGCANSVAPDPGLEGLSITKVAPVTVVPGSKLVVKGASFVDQDWGIATLRLVGKAGGQNVDLSWPAKFVDFSTMTVSVDGTMIDALGGDIDFAGEASVEIVAVKTDGETYKSEPIQQDLSFRRKLTPTPTGVVDGVIFVNDQIEVDGDGFLLGGEEGTTYARVTGCFQLDTSSTCSPIAQQDIAMVPREELSRQHAAFPFSPKVAGILPGSFVGEVTILNKHAGGAEVIAQPIDVDFTLVTSQVFSTDPPGASLSQYVFVHGGGFVGGEAGAGTELELSGMFNKTGMSPVPVTMQIVPEFVEGRLVRYALNKDDELGNSLDLRTETGHFAGKITPLITYGGQSVRGVSTNITFDILPVKQVVYLKFTPGYVEGLRDFGLRAVDNRIRERILAVLARIYKGVNIEFRTEPVSDFFDFSEVTITGIDPNDMGLFGYDNSPGKDNGNDRLQDKLGGFNALTQMDGYPGYGGVFLRSLMGFSKHPGSFAKAVPGADPVFDKIFDPFRADQDGTAVTASDLSTNLPALSDGGACPATDRSGKIQCAIFVMGNMIGGTLGHEIGHSLGLANPYAEGFHNAGDAPARLMDSGGDRPFMERAELMGQAPAVFCDEEYSYLREILRSPEPENVITRPTCY